MPPSRCMPAACACRAFDGAEDDSPSWGRAGLGRDGIDHRPTARVPVREQVARLEEAREVETRRPLSHMHAALREYATVLLIHTCHRLGITHSPKSGGEDGV